jgi:hypothetical protein
VVDILDHGVGHVLLHEGHEVVPFLALLELRVGRVLQVAGGDHAHAVLAPAGIITEPTDADTLFR